MTQSPTFSCLAAVESMSEFGVNESILSGSDLSIEDYDQQFNDLIKNIYVENKSVNSLIYEQNNFENARQEILGLKCMEALELQHLSQASMKNESPLSFFKTVPQICIPMTVPVKFVIG